eukprot:2301990-Pyramimonas_sp.AAC.1
MDDGRFIPFGAPWARDEEGGGGRGGRQDEEIEEQGVRRCEVSRALRRSERTGAVKAGQVRCTSTWV